MIDRTDNRARAAGGGGGGPWDHLDTARPVYETALRTSTNGDSRDFAHLHETETSALNSPPERITRKHRHVGTKRAEAAVRAEDECSPQNSTRPLACPYLKNTQNPSNHRCSAGKFPTIPRLKEHLYRVHQQQPHCMRCGKTFTHLEDVKAHLSRPDICDAVRGVSVEGLTPEQIQKLKSKKRKAGVRTDADKWQDIFKIVFPDATHYPDPYYRFLSDHSHKQNLVFMDQRDIENIFSEIPSESEERLFTKLEPVYGHSERRKRQKVLDTIKGFLVDSVQRFRERKALSLNEGTVCPAEPSSHILEFKTAAPESEQITKGDHRSVAQNYPESQRPPVLQTTSRKSTVEPWQADVPQGSVECIYSSLPNGTILDNKHLENDENRGSEVPSNDCIDGTGQWSTGIMVNFDIDDFSENWVEHSLSWYAGGAPDDFQTS